MRPQHGDGKAKQTGQVVGPLYSNILNTSRSSVKCWEAANNVSLNTDNRVAAVSRTSLLYFTNRHGICQPLSGHLQVCLHATKKKVNYIG